MLQWDLQSLSVSINEGLEKWFIMGDGLQDVPISCHVADGPLAEAGAAQPEDVTERKDNSDHSQLSCYSTCDALGNLLDVEFVCTCSASVVVCVSAPEMRFYDSRLSSASHLPGLWMNRCSRALTSS